MTNRSPVCDGHQDVIPPGADYATIVTPGEPDKHLCQDCARLIWRYLPDLVRHRAFMAAQMRPAPAGTVRQRAMSISLPAGLKPRRK